MRGTVRQDIRSVFEPKLYGWRALVSVDGTLTVRTRTGLDLTANVPHLPGVAHLGRRMVLDGELVADAGRARDFYRLGGRVRSSGATGEVTFVAFDVEGVVAKRVESPYRPDVRSGDWLKLETSDWKSAHAPMRRPR
jgi:ATP-dependent DNA ligase